MLRLFARGPGDFLISSDVPGCAMKDDPEQFPVGYICARAAERVKWADLKPDADGVKRANLSVLFDNFARSGAGKLASLIKAQQVEIEQLRRSLAAFKEQFTAAEELAKT